MLKNKFSIVLLTLIILLSLNLFVFTIPSAANETTEDLEIDREDYDISSSFLGVQYYRGSGEKSWGVGVEYLSNWGGRLSYERSLSELEITDEYGNTHTTERINSFNFDLFTNFLSGINDNFYLLGGGGIGWADGYYTPGFESDESVVSYVSLRGLYGGGLRISGVKAFIEGVYTIPVLSGDKEFNGGRGYNEIRLGISLGFHSSGEEEFKERKRLIEEYDIPSKFHDEVMEGKYDEDDMSYLAEGRRPPEPEPEPALPERPAEIVRTELGNIELDDISTSYNSSLDLVKIEGTFTNKTSVEIRYANIYAKFTEEGITHNGRTNITRVSPGDTHTFTISVFNVKDTSWSGPNKEEIDLSVESIRF